MTDNMKDFLLFSKNHRVVIGVSGKRTMYCMDLKCVDCVLSRKCNDLNDVGSLRKKELKEVRVTYPEYFI
jgi:hypothetical protein